MAETSRRLSEALDQLEHRIDTEGAPFSYVLRQTARRFVEDQVARLDRDDPEFKDRLIVDSAVGIVRDGLREQAGGLPPFEVDKAGWCITDDTESGRSGRLFNLGVDQLEQERSRLLNFGTEQRVDELIEQAKVDLRNQIQTWNAKEDNQETCFFSTADEAEAAVKDWVDKRVQEIESQLREEGESSDEGGYCVTAERVEALQQSASERVAEYRTEVLFEARHREFPEAEAQDRIETIEAEVRELIDGWQQPADADCRFNSSAEALAVVRSEVRERMASLLDEIRNTPRLESEGGGWCMGSGRKDSLKERGRNSIANRRADLMARAENFQISRSDVDRLIEQAKQAVNERVERWNEREDALTDTCFFNSQDAAFAAVSDLVDSLIADIEAVIQSHPEAGGAEGFTFDEGMVPEWTEFALRLFDREVERERKKLEEKGQSALIKAFDSFVERQRAKLREEIEGLVGRQFRNEAQLEEVIASIVQSVVEGFRDYGGGVGDADPAEVTESSPDVLEEMLAAAPGLSEAKKAEIREAFRGPGGCSCPQKIARAIEDALEHDRGTGRIRFV